MTHCYSEPFTDYDWPSDSGSDKDGVGDNWRETMGNVFTLYKETAWPVYLEFCGRSKSLPYDYSWFLRRCVNNKRFGTVEDDLESDSVIKYMASISSFIPTDVWKQIIMAMIPDIGDHDSFERGVFMAFLQVTFKHKDHKAIFLAPRHADFRKWAYEFFPSKTQLMFDTPVIYSGIEWLVRSVFGYGGLCCCGKVITYHPNKQYLKYKYISWGKCWKCLKRIHVKKVPAHGTDLIRLHDVRITQMREAGYESYDGEFWLDDVLEFKKKYPKLVGKKVYRKAKRKREF